MLSQETLSYRDLLLKVKNRRWNSGRVTPACGHQMTRLQWKKDWVPGGIKPLPSLNFTSHCFMKAFTCLNPIPAACDACLPVTSPRLVIIRHPGTFANEI